MSDTRPVDGGRIVLAVDTHAHIFCRGLPLAADRRYAPDYDALLEDYLSQLDRHGIAYGVLVQPSFLGTDNRYMVRGLREAQGRLRGIAVLEPTTAPEELERLNGEGVVGVRLNLIGMSVPDLEAGPWPVFLQRLAALDWQVEVHCAAGCLPLLLPPLLDAGLKVVVDHFGRPDPQRGIGDPGFDFLLQSAGSGRVWVKLSGAYRNGGDGELIAQRAMPALLSHFGVGRLLWGSDWPHTQFETRVDYAHAHALSVSCLPEAAARLSVLAETPAALFRFTHA
ncbi:amidohydrolase family protein [Paludibacterium yongneupense]|uniref:amidohydrolase family protein n=1 Tax=Paludibacterium yongneupense TaxID=400061 RepID=UPI00041E1006|nr:amidohydrolase family protein [Paludibacterium yongneupense]